MILHSVGLSCSTFTFRVWIPCFQILSGMAFLAGICHLVEGDLKDSLPSGICSGYHPLFKCLETELKKKFQIKEEHFVDFLSAITASRRPLPVWTRYMSYPLRRVSRTSFLYFQHVYSVYCNLTVHTWNTKDSAGESKKKTWVHFPLYLDSVLV